MADAGLELPLFDVTARKVHQWSMVALTVLGFLLSGIGPLAGAVPLVIAGVVMLVGRFWWPADIFRQLTWRLLEPACRERAESGRNDLIAVTLADQAEDAVGAVHNERENVEDVAAEHTHV